MNPHTSLIDRYIAAWNETDAARRRELIAATWTDDASYVDPLFAGDGQDGIDALIRAVHERFPHHAFLRTTDVDGFGNRLRFSWALMAPGGDAVAKGSDFAVVDSSGRLSAVTGFLDAATGIA